MSAVERLVTAEEFARMPESSHDRYELVEGRLVRISRPNFDHGRIVVQLAHLLKTRLEKQREGVAVVESGFILASDPDTVRGPDVSFAQPATLRDADDVVDLTDAIPGFTCRVSEIFE